MKAVIHPDYGYLTDFIRRVPRREYRSGQVFRHRRNRVEKVEPQPGTVLIVKTFKTHNLFHRLFFTLFPGKARLSYENSLRLQAMGIATAPPVAYLETHKNGLFDTGYFISSFLPDPLMDTIEQKEENERRAIIADFAAFTVALHEKGVCHHDYNLSNVFFRKAGDHYTFTLIDINRTLFRQPSRRQCLRELTRLQHISLPTMVSIIEQYARLRDWNVELCCAGILLERTLGRRARFKRIQQCIRRLFVPKKKKESSKRMIPEMAGK